MYCRVDQNETCTLIVFTGLNVVHRRCYHDPVWYREHRDIPPYTDFNLNMSTLKDFVRELRKCVTEFDTHQVDKPFKTRAIVQFTTVTTQKVAEHLLEKFGVPRVIGPIEKIKHPEGKLSIWAMPVKDFLTELENHERDINKANRLLSIF